MLATAIRMFLCIASFAGLASAGTITPICALHADANGDCRTDLAGQEVCVRGTVLAWKQFGSSGPGFLMDDAGCCIAIDGIAAAADFPIGTQLEVCGQVQNVSGLAVVHANSVAELGFSEDPGGHFIDCFTITQNPANAELAEGCEVLNCGTFAATGTFEAGQRYSFVCFAEDGFPASVYIDPETNLVGTPIPQEDVILVGMLVQIEPSGPGGEPIPCMGWEIWPRSTSDIDLTGHCVEAIEATTWGQLKSLYREP